MRQRAFPKPITLGPDSDGYFSYREAKPQEVPANVLQVGRAAAALCKDELGVDYALRWIYPTSWGKGANRLRRRNDIGGLATGSKQLVRVRADAAEKDVAFIVAHESRHHWQLAHWTAPRRSDTAELKRWEGDANEWADGFMRRHWPIDPDAVFAREPSVDVAGIAEQLAALNRQLERSRVI